MINIFEFRSFRQFLFITLLIVCFLQYLIVENSYAQVFTWDDFVEKMTTDEEMINNDWENLLDDLTELHEHPFNINTVTKEELEELPFLDSESIEDLLAYVYRYGPVKSLGELILIKSLSYEDRQYLSLFLYVGDPEKRYEQFKLKNLLKDSKNELTTTLKVPLYQRDGYKTYSDEELLKNPNKVYLGNALYHSVRYQYQYKDRLFWGLTMEKDAGEPFGSYGNWSYDAFSFHILLKNCGKLKTLALGDYRIGFGEGLIVNTDFSLGKVSMLSTLNRNRQIRKFSSTSETGFFRGMAAAFQLGRTELSFFYSYLPQDATLKKDGTISSLKTDGMHRTLLEVSKKHNIVTQSVGSDLTWKNKFLSIGLTGFYQHYDIPFSTSDELYRRYYPSGKDFFNVGLHYQLKLYKFLFSGETAYGQNHNGWATLNRIVYRFNHKYQIVALQRLYSYQYVAVMANSFEEGGAIRNESGFYIGAECKPLNELKIAFYADYFYFPWPKYGVPFTSDGYESMLQIDWFCSDKWNLTGRYQVKRKYRYDTPYLYHKLKCQLQYDLSNQFLFRIQGRYTRVKDNLGKTVFGYLGGITSRWINSNKDLRLSLSLAYFDSRDYKAPMSFYETGLLYSFSFLNFYGNGLRTAASCRWDITDKWMVICKYGLTYYMDRDEISSGPQRIDGCAQNDVSFQLRYKF